MARTITAIKTQIITEKNNQAALTGLYSVSQVSIYNLWAYVIATALFIQESLWDLFKTQLDTQISLAPAWTDKWVQTEALKFQYDGTTPQILTLNNFVPSYLVVDTTKQIISRCSVLTRPNRTVSIKVATNTPPQALTAPQLTSFQGFLDEISPAGVSYLSNSYASDKLMVDAQILYNGQYASSISNDVVSSINNYLANLEFDGYVRLSSLENAILNTTGVNDVVLNNVSIRPDSVGFLSGATYMLLAKQEIYNKYPMYAGYCIPEITGGYTLTDKLVFTVGN